MGGQYLNLVGFSSLMSNLCEFGMSLEKQKADFAIYRQLPLGRRQQWSLETRC
jgi:hypothetical protein